MYEIVDEVRAGRFILLILDRPIEEKAYNRIIIGDKKFEIVPSFGIPGVAIESDSSFIGQRARLVLSDNTAEGV